MFENSTEKSGVCVLVMKSRAPYNEFENMDVTLNPLFDRTNLKNVIPIFSIFGIHDDSPRKCLK